MDPVIEKLKTDLHALTERIAALELADQEKQVKVAQEAAARVAKEKAAKESATAPRRLFQKTN